MDTSCLDYLITDEQRQHFEEQGYLIVRDVLSSEQIEELTAAVDRIWEVEAPKSPEELELFEQQRGFIPKGITPTTFHVPFVGREQVFIDLIDHPKTFPIIWGILGWNIHIYVTHLGVKLQDAPESEPMKVPLRFHQDSGRVNRDIETHPRPRLSLKVSYWLNDVSEPGRGNMYIIPGGHLKDTVEIPEDRNPDGAIPILANPGDAVFFDRRLWHAASPNHSSIVRKAIFYGYGYRWIHNRDFVPTRPDLFKRCDPIRQQLLGAQSDSEGVYSPFDEDVPLKLWLQAHGVEVME